MQNRYVLSSVIGKGAFGTTYLAFDEEKKRWVAVKVYPSETDLQFFQREMELVKESGDISGLVKIYDFFEDEGQCFLVMEYLSGGSLKEYVKTLPKKRMPLSQVLAMLRTVMEALAYLHSMGIVHCDISADNIMLDEEKQCRLIDLGAARKLQNKQEESQLKEAYGAPEQYANPENIGPWTDVYGLCALLYELLSGVRVPAAVSRVRKDKLQPLSALAKVPVNVESAIMRGLELEIPRRFFSVEMLMQQLFVETEAIKDLSSAVRHHWGQLWVSISARGRYAGSKHGKNGNKQRRFGIGLVIFALVTVTVAGIWQVPKWRLSRNKEEYFQRELQMARESVEENPDNQLFLSTSEKYEETLEFLEDYLTEESDLMECYYYEVPEEKAIELGIPYNESRKLYLAWEILREAAFYYMDVANAGKVETTKEYEAAKNYEVLMDETKGNQLTYSGYAVVNDSYEYGEEKIAERIKLCYDSVDNRGIIMQFYSESEMRVQEFILKMLPVCCPEGYLTEEEIQEIFKEREEKEETLNIKINEKSCLQVAYSEWENLYYVKIAAAGDSLFYVS